MFLITTKLKLAFVAVLTVKCQLVILALEWPVFLHKQTQTTQFIVTTVEILVLTLTADTIVFTADIAALTAMHTAVDTETIAQLELAKFAKLASLVHVVMANVFKPAQALRTEFAQTISISNGTLNPCPFTSFRNSFC